MLKISKNVLNGQQYTFSFRFGDRPVLLAGLAIIFCGFFILLPWGNHYPKIQWAGMDNFYGYKYFSLLCKSNF